MMGLAFTRLRVSEPLILPTFATAPAGRHQRLFAAAVCGCVATLSLFLLPFVTDPMPVMPAFLAMNQSALVIVYGLTSLLFFVQFGRTRSTALLVLGAGSLYAMAIVFAQLVCFPNMLALGLLLGQGAATLTWLWNFWHLGPPLYALAFTLRERNAQKPAMSCAGANRAVFVTLAAVAAAVAVVVEVAVRHADDLPLVWDADGGYRALTTSGVGPALIVLTAAAMVLLCWTTRLRSVLQLWLAVSLFVLLLDNVITDLGAARASMGWFVGRVEALISAIVVLGVYLAQIGFLQSSAEHAATSRDLARAEAEVAHRNLEIALEASAMGAWELDLASDTTRRTLKHDRLFGYTQLQPAWGRTRTLAHVHPEDRAAVRAAFEDALESGRLALECRILRADDQSVRWISMLGRAYFAADGHATTMAGCIMDVTDRKQTEARLRHSQRIEAIGQLTGGVAHDFNNLLTILLGSLELIIKRPEDSDRVVRLAQSALRAGRRGIEITEKLLSFSRQQIASNELIDANTVLTEFRPLVQRAVGESVAVELDLDPAVAATRLDCNQLQAVLLNLAGNARDAMPNGGRLRLQTRNVFLGDDHIATMPEAVPGAYVQITVVDTGVGMDAQTAAQAFEPFFTTKAVGKGTGLGLSQVYGFARQAGGHCRVRTAPGQGCAVEIYFRRSDENVSAACASDAARPEWAARGAVVLLVEDDDVVREVTAESLSELGYEVLTAPDARLAKDLLTGPRRIDVLFSDIVMPGGTNGAQLAREARALRPNLKVLLTSGYSMSATDGSGDLLEDMPLLRKPYMPEDLAEKLRLIVSHRSVRQPAPVH